MFRRSRGVLSPPGRSVVDYDLVISGGGIVGATMMAAVQQVRKRLRIDDPGPHDGVAHLLSEKLDRLLLVDQGERPRYDSQNMMHHLRTVSLTPVASKIVDTLQCWERLETKHSYYRMALRHEQISCPVLSENDRSTSFFMSGLLGATPSTEPVLDFVDLNRPLGFICYNAEVNAKMLDVIEEFERGDDNGAGSSPPTGVSATQPDLRFGCNLDEIRLPGASEARKTLDGDLGRGVMRQCKSGPEGDVEVRFSLLLGCEGRGSQLRTTVETASIQHDYCQTGYVCTARIAQTGDGNVCTFQNFFRDGSIIAFLPTSPDTANIVFSTKPSHARELMAMTQKDLVRELNRRLHDFAPRDIPQILEVPEMGDVGESSHRRAQGSFPLKLNIASSPCSPRCFLLGDAAHGIHPMAGQGLNLGLYDVCALAEILEDCIRIGSDVGSMAAAGDKFAGEMLAHTAPMIVSMEGIKTILSAAPGISCLGMTALQKLPIASTYGKSGILYVASGGLFASRHKRNFLIS